MVTRLKICGITNLEDALKAVHCGVDMLGFNFYPASPRYVSNKDAKKIIEKLPFYIQKIGIFVQSSVEKINRTVLESGITGVQIYEVQSDSDLIKISLPIIYALRVTTRLKTFTWPLGAHMVLVDSFSPEQYGGTGDSFPWQHIPDSIPKEKLILAGGINPSNIKTALEFVNPAVIDVASGAETEPGKKDLKKIQLLVKNILEFNLQNGSLNNGI